MTPEIYIKNVLSTIKKEHSNQNEFYQAVKEVLTTLLPLLREDHRYLKHRILERIVVAERSVIFRVCWSDDNNQIQTHYGYRVQFNSAIGPYKGGLRFHPSVNLGIMKFLAFEQTFKNALTGLHIGGAKGGSNFDPKGKSDSEIMRFCQSYMSELYRYIGQTKDIPAGDIGVGQREIGYLFGQYKKLTSNFEGSLTGKKLAWGGSNGRKEATGYGVVYFAEYLLNKHDQTLKAKRCCVSGSGNVAIYTIEKLYDMGALPIACSDSKGTVFHKKGIDLQTLKTIKEINRQSLEVYAQVHTDAHYIPLSQYPEGGHAIWSIACDVAFACATQNELNLSDAQTLVQNGCMMVVEGANMPTTISAIEYLKHNRILFAPAKAANAGGVATSQLEMSQNASMTKWSFEEVDIKLRQIMRQIFDTAYDTSVIFGHKGDLVTGANIASFRKVADAMIDQGVL